MPVETSSAPCVAVVVTFNRSAMVRRLLARLQSLSDSLDHIIVVDNASTDDTAAALAASTGPLPMTVLTMHTNTGGAGGFAAGLAKFLDLTADAPDATAWLMDDDGLPATDCLAILRRQSADLDFSGPLVVAEGDEDRLCFPMRVPGTTRMLRTAADARAAAEATPHGDIVPGVVIPFNGVLLRRDLVARIGIVRSEFFIWGDDVEYLWRAARAGARVGTCVDAVFTHPATDDLGTPTCLGTATYNHSPSDLKHYCMSRNNTANLLAYRSPAHVAAFVAKTLWFYTVTRPDPRRLVTSARGMAAGLRGDFSGHRRYLP